MCRFGDMPELSFGYDRSCARSYWSIGLFFQQAIASANLISASQDAALKELQEKTSKSTPNSTSDAKQKDDVDDNDVHLQVKQIFISSLLLI